LGVDDRHQPNGSTLAMPAVQLKASRLAALAV